MCKILFSAEHVDSPGHRYISAHLAARAALRIPSPGPDTSYSVQSEGTCPYADINIPTLASNALAGRDKKLWQLSLCWDLLLQAKGSVFSSTPGAPAAVGLGPEWLNQLMGSRQG